MAQRRRSMSMKSTPTDLCVARLVRRPPGESGVSKLNVHSSCWIEGGRGVSGALTTRARSGVHF